MMTSHTEAVSDTESLSVAGPRRLWTGSFVALLITQFMVGLNDNVFRWLIIPIGKCAIGWSDSPDEVRMIGALAFLLPFLMMTSYAGYFCDRFNRRTVIICCKVAELLILIGGTVAILSQSVPFMLVILFLLGAQSAFFSPAKYCALPSIVPTSRISEANGIYAMTTMVACIAGQLLGGFLFVWTTMSPEQPVDGTGGMTSWWIWSGTLLGIAVIGLISSFFIPSLKAGDPNAKFPVNPFKQTYQDLGLLFSHRFLFWVALGSSVFWGLAALAQTNIDKFAAEMLHVRQDYAMILLVALTLGLALGSLLSGWWSRGKVELGLVPIGALMIIICALFLSGTPDVDLPRGNLSASCFTWPFIMGAIGLFCMGASAGIYDVPLLTTMQTHSPEEHRGRLLAAYNFYSFSAMALFSLLQGVLASAKPALAWIPGLNDLPDHFGLEATGIWAVCALIYLPILVMTARSVFIPLLRVLVSGWLWLFYHPRLIGIHNIPEKGGVLLVGNHVSYLDALLLYCNCRRPIRFIAHNDYVPRGLPFYIAVKTGMILFVPGDKKSVIKMIREARAALARGEVVCIFPEGGITRTGQVNPFAPGFLALLKKDRTQKDEAGQKNESQNDTQNNIPVVPFFLGGLWGSKFAYARPKEPAPWWERMTAPLFGCRLIQRPTVAFGKPFFHPKCAQHVQHIVEELGVDVMDPTRFSGDRHLLIPARQMIRNCRRYPGTVRLADSTGAEITGRQILLKTLVLRRFLHRLLKKVMDNETGERIRKASSSKIVGLLFPTSVAGVLINIALGLDRKVPVNINFTLSIETTNYCIEKLGITHVLATKRLLQKMPELDKLNANVIILEDAAKEIRLSDKIVGVLESLLPTWLLERILGLTRIKQSELNTIVLTSGSTGLPKGALLSHSNVTANMQGFYQVYRPTRKDRILAALPLFHSYGYSTMSWFPVIQSMGAIYHFSPLDSKMIGELSKKYDATIIASTPTFYRNYIRRCAEECFANVDLVVAGAEKLSEDLALAWKEKYGQEMIEGFGVTELAPVLSCNIPDSRRPDEYFPYNRPGSIGRILPGFVARIVDLDTGEELLPGEQGMLEVKGHSVTTGYYNDPERTEKAFHNGWYVTGDIARMDEQGFIFITGRQTRMSKIGGEMVPHVLIEERLWEITKSMTAETESSGSESSGSESAGGESDAMETVRSVVTAVPDEKKGEKIVVLYTSLPGTPEEICHRLQESGLPPIWVPSAQNFRQVEKIPILGTGKLSLKEIKDLALEVMKHC